MASALILMVEKAEAGASHTGLPAVMADPVSFLFSKIPARPVALTWLGLS